MIKGLTDRGLSFPQIGNIRKGGKSISKTGVEYPVDLKHFRVEFDAKEAEAEKTFLAKYGATPTEINILLPFNDIDRCWDAWCEAYTAGRMVARSDGEYFIYRTDIQTGELLVKDGLDKNGSRVPHVESLGVVGKTPVKCKPVGRLKVIIPELQRLAYLVVHTTSVIDVRNISEQLEAIRNINGGNIAGIPLVLKRRPRMISIPKDGTRVRVEKWMLSIEADPRWVSAKLASLDRAALPDGSPARLALPNVPEETDAEEDNWHEDIEDEVSEGEFQEQKPTPEPEPEPIMPIEEAAAVFSSIYQKTLDEMETADLQASLNRIITGLGDKKPNDKTAHTMAAIATMLIARAEGRPVKQATPDQAPSA